MNIFNEKEQWLTSVPLPEKTDSYSPIPHSDFISGVQDRISVAGFEIARKQYYIDKSGNKMIGRFTLSHREEDLALQVAFRNSYDKSMSAAFVMGATVMICSNGMISGEYALKRKHTSNDVREEIQYFAAMAIEASKDSFEHMVKIKNELKAIEFSQRNVNELMGRMYFDTEIIKTEQMSLIKELKNNPTIDYGNPNSAWAVYNLCTQALEEKVHVSSYIKQSSSILAEVNNFCGIEDSFTFEPYKLITNE